MPKIIHTAWFGDPFSSDRLTKAAFDGPLSIARKASEGIEVHYWAQEKYIDIIKKYLSDQEGGEKIIVKSFESMLDDLASKPGIADSAGLTLLKRTLTKIEEMREFHMGKELLSPMMMYLYGGYFFDTTVQINDPDSDIILLFGEEPLFAAPDLERGPLEVDVWAYYSPKPEHEIFKNYFVLNSSTFFQFYFRGEDVVEGVKPFNIFGDSFHTYPHGFDLEYPRFRPDEKRSVERVTVILKSLWVMMRNLYPDYYYNRKEPDGSPYFTHDLPKTGKKPQLIESLGGGLFITDGPATNLVKVFGSTGWRQDPPEPPSPRTSLRRH